MSRSYFLASADWQELKAKIEEIRADRLSSALGSSGPTADLAYASMQYERGWYDALGMVLDLPNEILKDGDVNAPAEPPVEGTRITHEREQPRHPIRFNRPY